MLALAAIALATLSLLPRTGQAEPDVHAVPADQDLASVASALCTNHDTSLALQDARNAVRAATAQQAKLKAEEEQAKIAAKTAAGALDDQKDKKQKPPLQAAADEAAKRYAAATKAREAADAQVSSATAARDAIDRDITTFCGRAKSYHDFSGHGYPRQYLKKVLNADVCPPLTGQFKVVDEHNHLQQICNNEGQRGALFTSASITLIQGIGDFVVGEAKQEVVQYLLEQVGKRFCDYSLNVKWLGGSGKIAMSVWFANSCTTMVSNGSINVDTFTFGDLEKAFKKDVHDLPQHLADLAKSWFGSLSDTEQEWIAVIGVVADVTLKVLEHEKPAQILEDIGDQVDANTKNYFCDFSKSVDRTCAALLLFQLARTAAVSYDASDRPVAAVISEALDQFCKNHGDPAKGQDDNGECVVSSSTYDAWQTRLQDFYDAVKTVLAVQRDIDRASLASAGPALEKQTGPEFAEALTKLVDSFAAIVENLPDLPPATQKTVKAEMDVLQGCVAVYAAIVGDDSVGLRTALIGLINSDAIGGKLSSNQKRAFTAIISLATAKDRAEVKDIMADVADPVGSYRMKYDADHTVIAVNAYVGVPLGTLYHLDDRTKDPMDPIRTSEWTRFKLSAPIGLDITPSFASSHWVHGGLMVFVADPLALDVDTKNDSLSADWKSIADFGASVRFGIARSPFSVLAGFQYRPWTHSDDMCGSHYCFNGEVEAGLFLAADVPVFTLR
jgi:hypothetical protein